MIKIAVATNIDYCEMTLPIIIKSLIDAGISKKDIFVFNAGFPESQVKEIDGIVHYFLNHHTYEYSPLIEILERDLDSIYWFLMQDTCKVGPRFKELLYSSIYNLPEKVALHSFPSMSIGLYRYDYLQKHRNSILGIKNYNFSKEAKFFWKNWTIANEDLLLWKIGGTPEIANGIDSVENVSYDDNWYGTDTKRLTEYYKSLDLYKNKSNWGQTGDKPISVL